MTARKTALAAMVAAGLMLSASAQAAISFASPKTYPTGVLLGPGPSADSMDSADFNNDGNIDLVLADPYLPFSTPVVVLGNGDGTFKAPIRINVKLKDPLLGFLDIPYVYATQCVDTGDVNQDGFADIAVETGPFVALLLGNGDGTFRHGTTKFIVLGGQLFTPLIDTNKDGKLDLVTGTAATLTTFLGDGTPKLGGGVKVSGPVGITAAFRETNLNNDQYPDAAVVESLPGGAFFRGVSLWKGNGDGSFAKLKSINTGFIPEDVVVADLDGDGIDDYATANSFSFNISVILSRSGFAPKTYENVGKAGTEDASIQNLVAEAKQKINESVTADAPAELRDILLKSTFQPGPVSIRAADLDNDGDQDLVVTSVIGIWATVYENDGTGKLINRQDLPITLLPQTPVLADFNKDGKIDIAIGGWGGALGVLINNSH
jgi:hypothetical protein